MCWFRNITLLTDGEMVADTNIDSTPNTLSGGWQTRAIKCHNDVMELPVSVRLLLFLKCQCSDGPPQHCVYCPQNAGVTHFSPARYFVLTLQISCMQCGGVASHAEYQKTHTSSGASYLSRALALIRYLLKNLGCQRQALLEGPFLLGSAQLRNKNKIFMDNWHSEKLTNTLLWLYSLMSSFYPFSIWLQRTLPWGTFSSLSLMDPAESDDGPIMWVRPGEQMIPVADIPRSPFKRKRWVRKSLLYIRDYRLFF